MKKLDLEKLMKIDGKTLREICKIGQGKVTCKFIVVGKGGYRCARLTSMQPVFEVIVQTAQGDNCPGRVRAS